jgi:type I restriction enzyme S subunit
MFEKYSEYKDCDVEWIGMVPKNWGIQKLKNFFKQRGSLFIDGDWIESKDIGGDDVNYFTTGNIGELQFRRSDPRFIATETFKKLRCTKVEVNDILISRLNVPLGRCCLAPKTERPAIVSVDVVICRPDDTFNRRYYVYVMNSPLYFSFSEIESRGAIMKRISRSILGNFYFPVPSLPEQIAIANFLDRKTVQIDQAIFIKEKQIELLKERRQILIHNAVTRGLDPNVEMKDSRVEWIGEIPEHWEVSANRILFTERNQPGREGLPLLSVSIHTAISSEELDEESNIRGKVKIEDKSSYKLVEVNDIVFNMMRAWQGAIGAVRTNGMVSPAYVVAKPNKRVEANYAEYQYRTSAYIQEMNRVSKGITDFRKRLYWHEFKQLTTILPPFEEQEEIVSYIENISEKITNAISLKQKEIEKLKEYKSTLINSAVTGKIKVS